MLLVSVPCPEAVLSPGMLHVMHNLTETMNDELTHFKKWLPGLKCLATLLGKPHLRRRFIATCLQGRHEPLAATFSRNAPTITSWRWNSIAMVLRYLMPLREPLRACWHETSFARRSVAVSVGEQNKLEIRLVTSTIQSDHWWAYGAMLLALNGWAATISSWCEGCPCHHWLRSQVLESQVPMPEGAVERFMQIRNQVLLGVALLGCDGPDMICPMAGRRAVEVACGHFEKELVRLTDSWRVSFLPACAALSEEDFMLTVREFHVGASHMQSTIQQKLQCWKVLPWKLCALGAKDELEACEAAKQCIDVFDRRRHMYMRNTCTPEARH